MDPLNDEQEKLKDAEKQQYSHDKPTLNEFSDFSHFSTTNLCS